MWHYCSSLKNLVNWSTHSPETSLTGAPPYSSTNNILFSNHESPFICSLHISTSGRFQNIPETASRACCGAWGWRSQKMSILAQSEWQRLPREIEAIAVTSAEHRSLRALRVVTMMWLRVLLWYLHVGVHRCYSVNVFTLEQTTTTFLFHPVSISLLRPTPEEHRGIGVRTRNLPLRSPRASPPGHTGPLTLEPSGAVMLFSSSLIDTSFFFSCFIFLDVDLILVIKDDNRLTVHRPYRLVSVSYCVLSSSLKISASRLQILHCSPAVRDYFAWTGSAKWWTKEGELRPFQKKKKKRRVQRFKPHRIARKLPTSNENQLWECLQSFRSKAMTYRTLCCQNKVESIFYRLM